MNTMSSIFVLLIAMVSAASPQLVMGAADEMSASYVQANAGRLEGKRWTVKVASVKAQKIVGDLHFFSAYTTIHGDGESHITVVVRAGVAAHFQERYGSQLRFDSGINIRARELRGLVRVTDGEAWLDCTDWRP